MREPSNGAMEQWHSIRPKCVRTEYTHNFGGRKTQGQWQATTVRRQMTANEAGFLLQQQQQQEQHQQQQREQPQTTQRQGEQEQRRFTSTCVIKIVVTTTETHLGQPLEVHAPPGLPLPSSLG